MSHLSAERLAALANGSNGGAPDYFSQAPTPEESAHLAACAECAREREAHRAVVALAGDERTRLAPPLTDWSTLSAALRAEGLIGGARDATSPALVGDARATTLTRRARWASAAARLDVGRRWGARAAAGVLLVAGGALAGRASAPSLQAGVRATATQVARGAADSAGRLVRTIADTTATFTSTTEALVALARAEQQYQVAAAYLLEHDTTGRGAAGATPRGEDSPSVYRARLAALDNMMTASRQALYEAPHDPVINRYYLATLGAREATLRQLDTALPEGVRLTRF